MVTPGFGGVKPRLAAEPTLPLVNRTIYLQTGGMDHRRRVAALNHLSAALPSLPAMALARTRADCSAPTTTARPRQVTAIRKPLTLRERVTANRKARDSSATTAETGRNYVNQAATAPVETPFPPIRLCRGGLSRPAPTVNKPLH